MKHWEAIAKRKAGDIDGWEWGDVRAAGDDLIVRGGVPNPGPRFRKWKGVQLTEVVVTKAEEQAEYERYERETGGCGECFGEGQVLADWHRETGKEYRPCPVCGGTGKANGHD